MALNKKKIKWITVIFLSVVFLVITVCVIIVSQRKQPNDDLRFAREALSEAKEAEADVYSETKYKQATQIYESAMKNWSRENDRFILVRDYGSVISSAQKAKKIAEESREESIAKADDLSKNVDAAFVSMEKKIELYNKLFKSLPIPRSVFDAHNKSKMFFSESKIAQGNGKLKDAEILFKKAEIYANHANAAAAKMLRDYFNDYGRWKSLANDAIAASRGGNKVILVDKVAHILYVYQSGKIIRSYDVEFGPNWMAHKEQAGDKATPEGNYHITSKKAGGGTGYNKAMLLDYPNAEDRAHFAQMKRQGLISKRAGIGNLIEIHGNGGRGFDWTSGCVGMRDRDIDDLYRVVGSGTRVTIVGSIEPLSTVTGGVDF
ncbi:lipoprotein [Aquipluma nitroreducens]|uniref:Lipoprotein n=1 Tax=Aquipluma nitroreducens TaxID=2010828 RepID=A0A5K7SDJ3_9BACT|nr:lipoprotein [Aquipluma nitroreducens]